MQTIFGWLIAIFSAAVAVLVVFRYEWVRKYLAPVCYWGGFNGFLGFKLPASRQSMFLGVIVAVVIGLMIAVEESFPTLVQPLTIAVVALLILSVPMGIRDFLIYRNNRNNEEKHKDGEQVGDCDAEEAV